MRMTPLEFIRKWKRVALTERAGGSDGRNCEPAGERDASDLVVPPALRPEEFAKISEVEGIRLTPEMERAFAEFDAGGLSHAERRRAIIARFKQAAE
jgi:hypothetical protein